MFNKNNFSGFLSKKIKQNKDAISLLISSFILVQMIMVCFLQDNVKKWIDKNYCFIIAFFVVLLTMFFLSIFFYTFSDRLQETYENFNDVDCLNCPKRNVDLLSLDKYKEKMNIYSLISLEEIEKNINDCGEIWLLTSDVKLETTVSNISRIMDENLKRGVSYKYFIPNTIKNSATILQLEKENENYQNFDLIIVDERYKFLFEKMDVVIYSPNSNSRKGFICVNFSDSNETHYFKKFSDKDLYNLIGQLKRIMEKNNEK